MTEQVLNGWQNLISQYMNKFLLTEQEMEMWYTAIEKMASDTIVEKYAQYLVNGQDSLLQNHRVHFSHLVTQKNINGEYNFEHNITVLDKTRAMLQKNDAVLTTIHEGVHYGQARVVSMFMEKQDVEHWCMNSAHNDEKRSIFDIDTQKGTYIRSKGAHVGFNELRACHYKLQFVERQAREITIEIGKSLNLDVSSKEEEFKMASDLLKARYGCHNMRNEDFFRLLDRAQMNVDRQLPPLNGIEANMMYDIVSLMHEQEYYIAKNEDERNQYIVQSSHLFEWDNKSQALTDAGYMYCNVVPFSAAKDISLEEIASMSQTTRDQSPLFMVYAIHEFGEDVVPYINKDSFDAWYFSHNQYFSEDMIWEVSDALGDKYNQIGLTGIACDEKTLLWFAINDDKLLDMNLQEFYDAENLAFGDLLRTAITPEEAAQMLQQTSSESIEIIDDEIEEEIDISDKR